MDRIVYLLGAGFSAPHKIPTMSGFYLRSKDMYFQDPQKYKAFFSVFRKVAEMAKAKNYYSTDLFNIEEILSILEMEESIGAGKYRKAFVKYISDVVADNTPSFSSRSKVPQEWHDDLFNHHSYYAHFVANLMNARISVGVAEGHGISDLRIHTTRDQNRKAEYSVVSLNYDLVLESLWDAMKRDGVKCCFWSGKQ